MTVQLNGPLPIQPQVLGLMAMNLFLLKMKRRKDALELLACMHWYSSSGGCADWKSLKSGPSFRFHTKSKGDSGEEDSIVFENESIKPEEKQESMGEAHGEENQQVSAKVKIYQYLYIQMEFCEKSTLL